MNIFISWSGDRSRALALALSQWLHTVNHYLHPWMSDRDIKKGDRWLEIVGDRLSRWPEALTGIAGPERYQHVHPDRCEDLFV